MAKQQNDFRLSVGGKTFPLNLLEHEKSKFGAFLWKKESINNNLVNYDP